MHTVFSDAMVWPTIRVDEAVRDGLDAISITDHLEMTPNKDYIPVNHNAAWEIARLYAKERNVILIHGTEITRQMPVGHYNALFIEDASLIARDSVWDSFEAAIKQGAFIQWNHPYTTPKFYDIADKLLKKRWLHGIEFFNTDEYYPQVMDWCIEHDLTIMGNSDIHYVISEFYREPKYINRPMTLVFAAERSLEAIKEALFAGRTLVWLRDILAGKELYAKAFFNECISLSKIYYQDDKSKYLEISNKSDIPFYLVDGPLEGPKEIVLPAGSVTRLILKNNLSGPLKYNVRNVIIGTGRILQVEFNY